MLNIFQRSSAGEPAMALGTGAVRGWQKRKGFHYLWMGTAAPDGSPIRWRVLSTEGSGGSYRDSAGADYPGAPLFLLCDDLLGDSILGGGLHVRRNCYMKFYEEYNGGWDRERPSSVWQNSDARRWCRRMAEECFSGAETDAVLATFKDDPEYTPWKAASMVGVEPYPAAPGILGGDRVFFLSAEETERQDYGFRRKKVYTAESEWWTRSYEKSGYQSPDYVDVSIVITAYGGLLPAPAGRNTRFFARPALNLNPEAVVFISTPEGKPAALPEDTAVLSPIPPVPKAKEREWKLTLRDRRREGFSAGPARREGDTLVIPFRGAMLREPDTAPGERISAIFTDSTGQTLKRYGAIALPRTAEGEARLGLSASGWQTGDRLFVFSEQVNGDSGSDYAGALVEVSVPEP